MINLGHIERARTIDENGFVSPAVITLKKDKSVKIALESRKLNDITIKRNTQMPNGPTQFKKLHTDSRRRTSPCTDTKNGSGLRLGTIEVTRGRRKSMHLCRDWGRFHRILLILKKILWLDRCSKCSNNFPGKDESYVSKQTPRMATLML